MALAAFKCGPGVVDASEGHRTTRSRDELMPTGSVARLACKTKCGSGWAEGCVPLLRMVLQQPPAVLLA